MDPPGGEQPTEPAAAPISFVELPRFRDASGWVKAWMGVSILAALIVPVVAAGPGRIAITAADLGIAAGLLVASICNVELGRLLDRAAREQQRPHKGLSAWAIATVVLLPVWYLIPVVTATYTHAWLRDRHIPRWKWAGSAAYMILAGVSAATIIRLLPGSATLASRPSAVGVLATIGACLVFMLVESLLLMCFAAVNRSDGEPWLRHTLADPLFYATEFGVLTLGAVTGLVAATGGWFVLLMAPSYLLMQQAVLHRPLQMRADTDAKTGVLQFRTWQRSASIEVAKCRLEGRSWSVLFADLDHFHLYNQRHGHLGGDEALAQTAAALQACLPPGGLIGRFGGEEFCMLLPGAGPQNALHVAERMRRRVATLGVPQLLQPITISIGAAAIGTERQETTVAQGLSIADGALYRAKNDGRNCCRLADGAPARSPR